MNQNEDDELEIQHRTLIEEENLDVSDLPNEIKAAMRKFNAKLDEYEETGDAELFFELQQDDVAIADDILTFVEDNEESDEDDEEEEEDDTYISDDEKDNDDNDDNDNQTTTYNTGGSVPSDVESQIRSVVVDGKISVEDLERIIRREPDYPNEQIGNLILKKQYLKPFYEVYER